MTRGMLESSGAQPPQQPVAPSADQDWLDIARGPQINGLGDLRRRPIPGVRTPGSPQTPPSGQGNGQKR